MSREARGTGLRLAVAGLRFRRSTAAVVLVLGTVASAAAVVAPLYSRAAEESVLRSTLAAEDAFTLAVQLQAPPGSGAGRGQVDQGLQPSGARGVEEARSQLPAPSFGLPRLAYAGDGTFAPAAGPFRGGHVAGQLVEREGACAHVALTAGHCPVTRNEALVSGRSLRLVGGRLGARLPLILDGTATEDGADRPVALQVVGVFDPPTSVQSSYWAGRPYFASFYPQASTRGLQEVPPTADPVFVGPGTAAAAQLTTWTVDTPLLPSQVRLGDTGRLQSQLDGLFRLAQQQQLITTSRLPAALRQADAGRRLVRVASPLAVTQLVLLSWWALSLVVGAAAEERSPELGLAKLRGLSSGSTTRFGLAEVLLLLLLAAPAGTLIGYLAVRRAAPHVFAPGTTVAFGWPVALTVLVAVAGGLVTAALSSRQVLRRPVTELLRRVPPRRRRRAGLAEVVVGVLAVAGVIQLAGDRGGPPSPLALLAPGLVAIAGGLLAGRLLVAIARRRSTAALRRGRAGAAAGWAGIARRPGSARIASVLAVATCLLLVGVQAWAVAQRNRFERSAAETGADVVLHTRAASSRLLLTAVRAADPGGRYAMAVVEAPANDTSTRLLAVDATRADQVLLWGAPADRPGPLGPVLHPALPDPLPLGPGRLAVTVDLQQVDSPSPLRLSARLDVDGTSTRLALGTLRPGTATYGAQLPAACHPDSCQLGALAVGHPGTDIQAANARLELRTVTVGAAALPTGFDDPRSWRPGAPTVGGPQVVLRAGASLSVQVHTPGGPDAEVVRANAPEPLPAVVGRDAVGDSAGPQAGTGLTGSTTRFDVIRAVGHVPRGGTGAALVDLDLALRLTADGGPGDGEVWLSRDDRSAERDLQVALLSRGVTVTGRETRGALERGYAGDGAVLALRLLLVCGAAAVLVAVGALGVGAWVGGRQRSYEVAALRVVGIPRRTVRRLLLLDSAGTVLLALVCGAVAALIAVVAVLPVLPEFDAPSTWVAVRYAPDLPAAAGALGALLLLLLVAAVAVAGLQLRAGRSDRLREGVR